MNRLLLCVGMAIFVACRLCDIVTTLIFMRLGGKEMNAIIGNTKYKKIRILFHSLILAEILLLVALTSIDAFLFAAGAFSGAAIVATGVNAFVIANLLRQREAKEESRIIGKVV